MKLGCVLMAAGAASRFGENKLLKPFWGVPLYLRAMDAIPKDAFCAVAAVSGTKEILAAAVERGFVPVLNDRPELGVSRTVRLGLEALLNAGAEAALFLVADQPLLTSASVAGLLDFFLGEPSAPAALSHGGKRGNPVIFPKEYFPALLALTGDEGGGAALKASGVSPRLFAIADARELMDVDTAEAFRTLAEASANAVRPD